jgi:hypothetical protein
MQSFEQQIDAVSSEFATSKETKDKLSNAEDKIKAKGIPYEKVTTPE